jgi:hypothetical protein
MLFNKTKTLVFLFTLFISSFTFSQSTPNTGLADDACDASSYNYSYGITYTDDGDDVFGSGDTISSSDTDSTFDYDGDYFYNDTGIVYAVDFESNGTGGYDITVSSSAEDTAICSGGGGVTGTTAGLADDLCDAFNNYSSFNINYTDDGDDVFGSGDTISSSDTDSTFDYDGDYFYNDTGIVYAVDFESNGTGGYDITVSSSPEDTASCSGGGGVTGTTAGLADDLCDAFNNYSSFNINYTDDGDDVFGSGDTISSSDTDSTFDYDGDYFYNDTGIVYAVDFESNGTGGYDITVSSSAEDTAICSGGGGVTGTTAGLADDPCDAFNNYSSFNINYTDDGDDVFGSGDTISSSDTDSTFDYDGDYFYNDTGIVYAVDFESNGTGGYDITVSSSAEDTAICSGGGGVTGTTAGLADDPCDAFNNYSSFNINYTDDGDDVFGSGDTISSSDTDSTFDYDGDYFYNDTGIVYAVDFESNGTGGYDITVSSSAEDTAICSGGGGVTGTTAGLADDPCDAFNNYSSFNINYTDDGDDVFGSGDTISSSDTDSTFDYDGDYFYNDTGIVYAVDFESNGTGGYDITVSSSAEDTAICSGGGGVTGTTAGLADDPCDAFNNYSSFNINYTDDGDDVFGSGDTISSSDTDSTFDYDGDYFYNDTGIVYAVDFESNGTGGYDITVSSSAEDTAICSGGGGVTGTTAGLADDPCDAFNNYSSFNINYTDDGDDVFGSGDTISSSDTDSTFDYDGDYFYNDTGIVYAVDFESNGTGGYDITVSSSAEDTAICSGGGGVTGTTAGLADDPCDAFNNYSSFNINYTDDGDDVFGSGDTISSSDTDSTFDYDGDYFYNDTGIVYAVDFESNGTGGYDITVSSSAEDTAICSGGGGVTGTTAGLADDPCDAFNNYSSFNINYTDDGDDVFGSGDTISSSDTDSTFDYDGDYFYNDTGIVYAVDFESNGTGGYDITVSSSPEDTAICSGGGGVTGTTAGLADDPCDAFNNYSSFNINYTDDGDDVFGSGDTISSSDTDSTFDYDGDYFYNDTGIVYAVDFESNGTGGYDITVSSSPEDTASCSGGGSGGTGTSPEFDETPSTSSVAQTKFTLNADINEEGIIYYVVVADGALAPSSSEVKAGTGNGGTGELASGNATVDSGDYIYEFSVSGLTGGTNYDVYLVAEDNEAIPNLQAIPEKLDVTTTELITLTINGLSGGDKAYDGTTDATASGTPILVGVESGDDVSLEGSPVFTFASANVGTDITVITTGYTLSVTAAAKYILTQPTLSANISAAALTVTADTDQTKVYGATDPTLTYSITGFENGDEEADLDTGVSILRAPGEDVDTYTITPSAAADSNYTVSFVTADFTITAADLTVTADADTKVYGATDPTLTYSITGFVNGDTEADLDTGVSISRAAGEDVAYVYHYTICSSR